MTSDAKDEDIEVRWPKAGDRMFVVRRRNSVSPEISADRGAIGVRSASTDERREPGDSGRP